MGDLKLLMKRQPVRAEFVNAQKKKGRGGERRGCTSKEASKDGALKVRLIDRRRPVRAEFVSARVVVFLLLQLPGMPPRELAYL